MSDLRLSLHRANARLRAWRAAGVPVEGPGWYPLPGERWGFRVRCEACRFSSQIEGWEQSMGRRWWHVERQAVRTVIARRGCTHLAPLLGEPPAEVAAIMDLELLAGE